MEDLILVALILAGAYLLHPLATWGTRVFLLAVAIITAVLIKSRR